MRMRRTFWPPLWLPLLGSSETHVFTFTFLSLITQGVDLAKVMEAGDFICKALKRRTNSKVALAKAGV